MIRFLQNGKRTKYLNPADHLFRQPLALRQALVKKILQCIQGLYCFARCHFELTISQTRAQGRQKVAISTKHACDLACRDTEDQLIHVLPSVPTSALHDYLEQFVVAFLYAADILLVLNLQLMKVDVMKRIAHVILLSELTLHLPDRVVHFHIRAEPAAA